VAYLLVHAAVLRDVRLGCRQQVAQGAAVRHVAGAGHGSEDGVAELGGLAVAQARRPVHKQRAVDLADELACGGQCCLERCSGPCTTPWGESVVWKGGVTPEGGGDETGSHSAEWHDTSAPETWILLMH